ncbi:MAG: DUF5060 domain-containing protein [Planctomycetes bacterium]|nr:DUF5060 domain-containing protein [Planctomycetota bacterium]
MHSRAGRELVLYDFEESVQGWGPLGGEEGGESSSNTKRCVPSEDQSCSGEFGLRVDGLQPGTVGAAVKLPAGKRNWHAFTHFSVAIYLPESAPKKIQPVIYVKDTDLYYYQHLRKNYLQRGRWTYIALDITSTSDVWEYRGHFKPWDGYCRQDVRELGIKFVGQQPYEGPFYIDRIKLRRNPSALPQENAIYNLRVNSRKIKQFEKFELSFNLARTYSNPFDPQEVKVYGEFRHPIGRVDRMPAFFYQGYLRRMEKGAEELTPMGRSQWKIRFTPIYPGRYRYWVIVKDNYSGTLRTEAREFECLESDHPGFIKISSKDPFFFEYTNGDFYFPIGHNIAAVHDARARSLQVNIPASEGTYAYDRMLSKMSKAGENWGRIWMSPWSFEIEWTKAYNTHYRGLGQYNLVNAWRLDHVLRMAEENNIYILLLFTAHGEIGTYESDFIGHDKEHAQGSPYWSGRDGSRIDGGYAGDDPHPGYHGPIDHPRQIYTNKEALEKYKQRARYIVARWGYSPAIMAWEILNEADLAKFYQNVRFGQRGARFVEKVARHIRRIDQGRHLITSGCFYYRQPWASPTLRLDILDFNTGHVFNGQLERRLVADVKYMQGTYNKIFLPTEAGLTPFAQDAETTSLAIHRTLWCSYMTPTAGTAAPWWWVLIDRRNLYPRFEALSKYARGEDRRGKGYESGTGWVEDEIEERELKIVVLNNEQKGFCWIYQPSAFSKYSVWQAAAAAPATASVRGLRPGSYRIEVWNTYEGKVIHKLSARSQTKRNEEGEEIRFLRFKLPAFARDIACKIERKN